MRVSVIGSSTVSDDVARTAEDLGRLVAQRGHTLVCGGLGGIMEAACRGARDADGTTVGILPGEDPTAANDYVETAVATGMGHARNALVVLNGDGVIAIDGASGTLTELGFALVYDRPIAGIGTHDIDGVEAVETPEQAVQYIERATGNRVETRRSR
ncbi:MAG: TIGR00725 family protein [Halobacteriota archaeon]